MIVRGRKCNVIISHGANQIQVANESKRDVRPVVRPFPSWNLEPSDLLEQGLKEFCRKHTELDFSLHML